MSVTYLLDTNACIRLLNGTSASVAARLATHVPADIKLSSVVKGELLFGARRSSRVAANLDLLRRFFRTFDTVPFDDVCADHYGAIRADLPAAGAPIGPNDLLIAATARAHDFVLVTANEREFRRVIGLRVEDWESSEP